MPVKVKAKAKKRYVCKMESSADISKDEFDSVSDLVIDENADNEAEEGKKMRSISFDLDCPKGDCNDVDISQETWDRFYERNGRDCYFDGMYNRVMITIWMMMMRKRRREKDRGEDEEGDDNDSYPPLSQNIHRPRYVKAEELNSSNSGGDIEQKWAKLMPGKKLPR